MTDRRDETRVKKIKLDPGFLRINNSNYESTTVVLLSDDVAGCSSRADTEPVENPSEYWNDGMTEGLCHPMCTFCFRHLLYVLPCLCVFFSRMHAWG